MIWNLVNTVTNGSKTFGRIKDVAVLTGDPINEGFFIRKCMAVLPAANITWPQ